MSTSLVEYANRLYLAKQLVELGCKWPIIHELLGIRIRDAQKLVHELYPDKRVLSRIEKGLYWWRMPGEHNQRMVHANFIYAIFTSYQYLEGMAEQLLHTYKTYLALVPKPVINNINRVYFLLDSIGRHRGFEFRTCDTCSCRFIAVNLLDSNLCPSCERIQYLTCIDCHKPLNNPYIPGKNGNKKRRCAPCGIAVRKKRRKLRRNRKNIYMPEYQVH